jgi:hypothetical protein
MAPTTTTDYNEMMAAALTMRTVAITARRAMAEDVFYWGFCAHLVDTSAAFYRGITRTCAAGAFDLAGRMTPALADLHADELVTQAERRRDEASLERPDCLECESIRGCDHAEVEYHGGFDRPGCQRIINGPPHNRCGCFDFPLAMAREINQLPQVAT